tara:strand:- start:132 stop:506 length:375 start_codon:yes stop_codon:yes gene_type:complete
MNFPNILNMPSPSQNKRGYKTDAGEPPESVDKKPCFGNYCLRATTKTLNANDEVINTYHGYSMNMERITQEVEDACEIRRRDGEKCTKTSVMFLQDVQNCNGMITQTDEKSGELKIISYGKRQI